MRVNLIHGREGAQYRRVRKLAEENMKKNVLLGENSNIVKELQTNNLTQNF